ncbi:MAG TPA: hypothetical protein VLM38_00365 [Blastocatellia bacterium]|nr:hypothetical protein [Blastocatellia bacterium]
MPPTTTFRLRLFFIALITAVASVHSQACDKHGLPDSGRMPPAGEPDKYSATVVRIVDDGARREVSITREFRSGEMRREEWIEQGRNCALIWAGDVKNAILLDLDAHAYAEVEITPKAPEGQQLNGPDGRPGRDAGGPEDGALQAIDRIFDERRSPDRVETRLLSGETIDGHWCSVYEERSTFPDGHTEVTKSYRATDLAGLALRVETTSQPGATKVITERRDVRIDIPSDAFVVPPSYRKASRY